MPNRQRLIDRGKHLFNRQFVETLAMAVEPTLAAFQLAWQARQRSMEARTLLEEICGWFGESATNLDLLEARALLEPRPKRRRSGST